ncbi:MAG: Thiosulfate sulfurtransferase GlpE [Opitutia bacterium UBA7350]|nr:MAG: Thiosulfate sulfurtransferase GlpE [Opitutae bacterium UBA7350]
MDKEINAIEAAKLLKEAESVLLDVREPDELEICSILGAHHIPMTEIPERIAEIPKDIPLVVFCHHGMRSMKVLQYLAERGYDRVLNLKGGIDAWALSVDKKMRRY